MGVFYFSPHVFKYVRKIIYLVESFFSEYFANFFIIIFRSICNIQEKLFIQ